MRWLWMGLAGGVVALFMLIGGGADAAPNEKEAKPFGKAFQLLLGKDELSQADRKSIAQGIGDICQQINQKIPSLSPKEVEWLNREISSNRAVQVYGTVEFARRQSKNQLGECYVYSRLAMTSNGVYEWSALLRSLMDWNLQSHARNLSLNGIITKMDADSISIFDMVAGLMMDKIILPDLKKNY